MSHARLRRMWLVERADVGAVAYARMQRDGVISTLIPGIALPSDLDDSPAFRRQVLREQVPPHCQVTALGALWVQGYCPWPDALDVRAPNGRHIRNWSERLPVTFHAVGAVADDTDHPGFAPLATAIADALRWAPLDLAIPASLSALADGSEALRRRTGAHMPRHGRAALAWQMVREALAERANSTQTIKLLNIPGGLNRSGDPRIGHMLPAREGWRDD